jgi:hypothetical protein
MTAYVAANWPVFLMAAGGLVLLISATSLARWWHQDGQHAAPADEDRQTIAWLARIRPRPLADARIRVAALTAAIQTAGQPPAEYWPVDRGREGSADLDQFLPDGPWYPQTLPPLPDEHPSWPGHADEKPTGIIRAAREISDPAGAELAARWREAYERERHQPLRVLPDGDWAESDRAICLCGIAHGTSDVPGPVPSGNAVKHLLPGREPALAEPGPQPPDAATQTTAWLSQTPDPAQAGHLQPLWADDTGSFTAICAGDL